MFPFKRFCAVRLWCCWRKAQSDRVTADTELLEFWSIHLTGRSLIPERCSSVCTPESSCAHTAGVWRWLNPDSSSPTIGGEILLAPLIGGDVWYRLSGTVRALQIRSEASWTDHRLVSSRNTENLPALFFLQDKYARRVRSELSEVTCSIIIIFRRVFTPMFWSNVPTLLLFFYTFPCTFFGWNSVLVWKDRMITSVVATPQQPEADIRSSWRSCWAAVNVDQIRSLPLLLLLLLVLLSFSHFLASWAFITSEFPQRSIQSCLIITL